MVTKRCNLRCPYCFANEFVNDSGDITINEFRSILDFILLDGSDPKLGLIGGEPTIHCEFDKLLNIIAEDERIKNCIIYTNGIKLKKFINLLENEKFRLLINCNDIRNSHSLFDEFSDSLDVAFHSISKRITLGANFYKPDYDYGYILELVKKYSCDKLRVSISLPNSKDYEYEPLNYFKIVKPHIFTFFRELKALGCIPFFDCNIMPSCVFTAEEMLEFEEWGRENPFSVIKNRHTGCVPVIDILPDGTAVRCFGLSEYSKTNIRNFACIQDLKFYYLRTVDAYALNSATDKKCISCYKFKTAKCTGGCLVYKIGKIIDKYEKECF